MTENRTVIVKEESEEGISYFHADGSFFSEINLLASLISKEWVVSSFSFNNFEITVYRRDDIGAHWIFIKKEDVEKLVEKIIKTA